MVGDIFLSYLRPPHIKSRAVNPVNKAVLVARSKLNSIENKISRALKDKENNPKEFTQQL